MMSSLRPERLLGASATTQVSNLVMHENINRLAHHGLRCIILPKCRVASVSDRELLSLYVALMIYMMSCIIESTVSVERAL